MHELCADLGHTPQRRRILTGLIALRERLRALGMPIAFQWIDGSFTENIEASEARPPNDIDVMSFVSRPVTAVDDAAFSALIQANSDVFFRAQSRVAFSCDHFLTDLSQPINIQNICYWHSLFTHRRNGSWKGYLSLLDEGSITDQQLFVNLQAQGTAP